MPAHPCRPHVRIALTVSLILILAWQLTPVERAHALACTSVACGNWSAPATWSGCNGATPTANDDVMIADGHTIRLDIPAVTVRSLSLLDGSAVSSLILNNQNALTVTAYVTAASSLGNARKTLAVGDSVLTIDGNMTLAGGTLARIAEVTINTGTVTIAGDINVNGTNAEITFTSAGTLSAGTLNVGGTFQSGGAFTAATGATVRYNSPDAQTMGG